VVRNHWDGGWITVFWKHLSSAPVPFGELVQDHARLHSGMPGKVGMAGDRQMWWPET
jgi:hypothetical protein